MSFNRSIALLSALILSLGGCVPRPLIKKTLEIHEVRKPVSSAQAPASKSVYTVEKAAVQQKLPPEPPNENRPGFQLKTGMKCVYRMDWLRIPVGYVTFEVMGEEKVNGRETYVLALKAESNKFASKIYRVDDTFTSFIDKETLLPVRYDVKRSDGNYRKNATTYFDREKGMAYFENFKDKSKKSYPIPKDVLDPVSCIVKIWTLDLHVGDSYVYDIDNNEQIYRIYTYVKEKSIIHVRGLGDFEAFYITPNALLNGELVKKGTVYGYIRAGEKKQLLYAEGRSSFFSKMSATMIETNI